MGFLAEIEAALKLWGTLKDLKLSQEEKELLLAATQGKGQSHGVFFLFDGIGGSVPFVQAGETRFIKDGEPYFAAKYRRAFSSLIKRGYVEHVGGIVFILTADGWEAAQQLDKSSR